MKIIESTIANPVYPYTFLQQKEQIAFLDIETTGLSPNASSLYLIGLMRFDASQDKWLLSQWFADNYQSEKNMINSFLEALSDIKFLYHFNGQTFDLPYLLKKCTRHSIMPSEHFSKLLQDTSGIYSIDLLKKIRPLRHALSLENCRQTECEHFLGLKRTESFSGADLIPVYSEYMQQKILAPENAKKLEQVLLLHNHDDLEMMLNLCSLLTYEEYLSEAGAERLFHEETIRTLKTKQDDIKWLAITFTLPTAVPKEITMYACYPQNLQKAEEPEESCPFPKASLTFQKQTALLKLPLYHGTLKFFFPDYKNYYYLPVEDTAIHKSVAAFVDSSYRKKATASTCYTKKEGTFLPDLSAIKKQEKEPAKSIYPVFFHQYKDKPAFFELTEELLSNHTFWKECLKRQLPCFRN